MAQGFNFVEALWTTESSGQLWNTCLWDIHTGAVLQAFKGGISAPNTLCLLKDDYLVSAERGKPLLHHWLISKKDSKQMRVVLPGKVEAMTITRDGVFCIAAIAENVHIWQVNSGRLLAIVSGHYQTVRCVKVGSDGCHLLTAGDDAIIHCWSIPSLVDQTKTTATEPLWSSSNHSLPITDMCVGCEGHMARAVSLSMDQSCRMYETLSGKQIACFLFDVGLTRVCLSACQTLIYVGSVTGLIYKVSTVHSQHAAERHVMEKGDNSTQTFTGHSKEVTSLALNMDGSVLASGSKDMTVRLWHTPSGQCVRTLPHKGEVTNVLITVYPGHMATDNYKPNTSFRTLDRHLYNNRDDTQGAVDVFIKPASSTSEEDDVQFAKTQASRLFNWSSSDRETFLATGKPSQSATVHLAGDGLVDNSQLAKALACNKQLYEFSLKLLSKKPAAVNKKHGRQTSG